MSKRVKILGAAVDVLDEPEKIGLKQAYLSALEAGQPLGDLPADPYDAIVPLLLQMCGESVTPAGKLEIPAWASPRPLAGAAPLITAERCRAFLDRETIVTYSEQCAGWAHKLTPPDIPGLIAVDHALSAGPVTALSERFGPEELAVVVLDAHFDAIPAPLRAPPGVTVPDSGLRNCGSFLAALLEAGTIRPENLFVVGAADYPREGMTAAYREAYIAWLEKGVTVLSQDYGADGILERLTAVLANHPASYLYVSLDADVGACKGMNAVRFLDQVGLETATVLAIAETLNGLLRSGKFALAGLDIAEVDVHLVGLPDAAGRMDRTEEVCARFMCRLLAGWTEG